MNIRSTNKYILPANVVMLFLVLALAGSSFAQGTTCPPLDEFQDVNCEDQSARLDNFAVTLNSAPDAKGTIVFYEGKYKGGRKPRLGEARANAVRMKDYLTHSRGIAVDKIVIVDGGYRENFAVQLYVCPKDVTPTTTPSVQRRDVKFRRGKILRRELKWSCL